MNMAASYTLELTCSICDATIDITNTTEAALGDTKETKYQCPNCGQIFAWNFTSIAVVHTGNVGSNTTVTQTITIPGSISSATS